MIDNFNLIKNYIGPDFGTDAFYHCQLVRRVKDHKPRKVKESMLKTYFIKDGQHLDLLKEEIVLLCNHYGARAYINLSYKDFKDFRNKLLLKLAEDINNNNVRNPQKLINSVAGELKSDEPVWVVDIDNKEDIPAVEQTLLKLYKEYYSKVDIDKLITIDTLYGFGIKEVIPTLAGCHLITKPFNLYAFHQEHPDIDVHKNSMGTLLYCPDFNN